MAKFEIETSPLWYDIQDIINEQAKPVKSEYRGMLHNEKEDIIVIKILNIDIVRDYANNVGDHVQVEFVLGFGDYVYRLFPYKTNLEFSIKEIPLKETEGRKKEELDIVVDRYKAVFLIEENENIAVTEYENYDLESLNKRRTVNVKLQLLDRSLEPIRIKTTFGIYQNVTAKKIIHNLLAGESAKILVDGKPSIDGIDIVEPDNQASRSHIIFPTGSLVVGVPTYLQEREGGVYNAGIGNYLQTYKDKKIWFVYPLFNTKRFDETKGDRVIIYGVPKSRFNGVDRTYRKEGNILHILATSDRRYEDGADVNYMNDGSGFRMADARALMKKPVELTDAGPKANRSRFNTEIVTEDRKDGLNHAPVLPGGPKSNIYKQTSRVLGRKVARIDFTWENSNPRMIYPGMPCKFIFLDNEKPVELKGTVVHIQTFIAVQGQGLQNSVYRTVSNLTLLTEEKPVVRTLKETTIEGKF